MKAIETFECSECGYIWEEPAHTNGYFYCPGCESEKINLIYKRPSKEEK